MWSVSKVVLRYGAFTVVATDSWLVRMSTYSLRFSQQRDVDMSIVGTYEKEKRDPGGQREICQILRIRVTNVRPAITPFDIYLESTDFMSLQDKLLTRIRNTQGVVIRQSLSDQFLGYLRSAVESNPPWYAPPDYEADTCVGCMAKPVDIAVRRQCEVRGDYAPVGEPCGECFCRPMWCLECLGKWFVSQQDAHQPNNWVQGRAVCPTCRARFCLRDIALIR